MVKAVKNKVLTYNNNALQALLSSVKPERKKYLGKYARALFKPMFEHIDDKSLDFSTEDAVFILQSLSLVFMSKLVGSAKIAPLLGEAGYLFTSSPEEESEELEENDS